MYEGSRICSLSTYTAVVSCYKGDDYNPLLPAIEGACFLKNTCQKNTEQHIYGMERQPIWFILGREPASSTLRTLTVGP